MPGKVLEVRETGEDDSEGSFTALAHIGNDEPGYPFSLDIRITYTLSRYGLSIDVTATNVNGDGTPLPFYMGWHPYFNCTAYTSHVMFDPFTNWGHVELNANMDPTGITKQSTIFNGSTPIGGTKDEPTFYDDEFKALYGPEDSYVRLIDTATGQTVRLWFDASFPFVHIYTGSSTTFHEDGVAMEPMSGMADAYNNHDGLSTISDGQTWHGSFGVYVE